MKPGQGHPLYPSGGRFNTHAAFPPLTEGRKYSNGAILKLALISLIIYRLRDLSSGII
jgi:hypothetical protein